jgi:hypothetical protein
MGCEMLGGHFTPPPQTLFFPPTLCLAFLAAVLLASLRTGQHAGNVRTAGSSPNLKLHLPLLAQIASNLFLN